MKEVISKSGVLAPIKRQLNTNYPIVSCTDGAFGWRCTIAPAPFIRLEYHNGRACRLL